MKEILSAQHPLVKYWVNLRTDSKFRKTESRVLLEGKNCVYDICQKTKAKRLIVSNESIIDDSLLYEEVIVVTDAIMKKISGVVSPEGIIAELELPENRPFSSVKKILVADGIQDPGNLGTIIRSLCAFGWDGLFLLPGCADPYNDKTLRAAKGATFHLPIFSGSWDELATICKQNHLELVVADTKGQKPEFFVNKPIALVLGNEAQGANVPKTLSHQIVSLPMIGQIESLNVAVAGSILLYLYQEGK
ncbi:MAG: RNA methyltransferase [Chlamydiales bacterium]|nr:RNA methyltransferase [Chlamydiales bacterium]